MWLDKHSGYVDVYAPQHAHARSNGKVRQHILVAEKALGKLLPEGAEVHHINGVRSDNRPENLVICHDRAYHRLLHQRVDALKACGNPGYRKCTYCQKWCDVSELRFYKTSWHHRDCQVAACRQRREKLRSVK